MTVSDPEEKGKTRRHLIMDSISCCFLTRVCELWSWQWLLFSSPSPKIGLLPLRHSSLDPRLFNPSNMELRSPPLILEKRLNRALSGGWNCRTCQFEVSQDVIKHCSSGFLILGNFSNFISFKPGKIFFWMPQDFFSPGEQNQSETSPIQRVFPGTCPQRKLSPWTLWWRWTATTECVFPKFCLGLTSLHRFWKIIFSYLHKFRPAVI